jgi:hypothetical protein
MKHDRTSRRERVDARRIAQVADDRVVAAVEVRRRLARRVALE